MFLPHCCKIGATTQLAETWTYDPELQENETMAMPNTAAICFGEDEPDEVRTAICFGEDEVRTLVLVEGFGFFWFIFCRSAWRRTCG